MRKQNAIIIIAVLLASILVGLAASLPMTINNHVSAYYTANSYVICYDEHCIEFALITNTENH